MTMPCFFKSKHFFFCFAFKEPRVTSVKCFDADYYDLSFCFLYTSRARPLPNSSSVKENYLRRWLLGPGVLLSCPPPKLFLAQSHRPIMHHQRRVKQQDTWKGAKCHQNRRWCSHASWKDSWVMPCSYFWGQAPLKQKGLEQGQTRSGDYFVIWVSEGGRK